MANSAWHFRKLETPRPLPTSIATRMQLFHEAKKSNQIRSLRARSKQAQDQDRLTKRLEKTRILQEAHYDNVNSIGEVDALTSSTVLDINRAEVLRDPKRRYIHPSLRNW